MRFSLGMIPLVFVMNFAPLARAEDPPTLEVCDVFDRLSELSGKMIAVRGRVQNGIQPLDLGECAAVPISETGRRWPSAIYLRAPAATPATGVSAHDALSVEFVTYLRKTLREVYCDVGPRDEQRGNPCAQPPFEIVATFVGVLRVAKDMSRFPGAPGSGVGYEGNSAAELEPIAVRDLVMTQNQLPGEAP